VRDRVYSQHEIDMINPLPQLISNYIEKNGPLRFDQFWEICQYFPGLGIYQKVRHFDNFFESVSSAKENLDGPIFPNPQLVADECRTHY